MHVLNPRGRIVQANGVGLCVETFGDPGDPAVVFIHGVGNCMLSWDDELCEVSSAPARRSRAPRPCGWW
jgi:pimeloyl-ACP methyl ester carboxylesterase